jgi:hypothetical protein
MRFIAPMFLGAKALQSGELVWIAVLEQQPPLAPPHYQDA